MNFNQQQGVQKQKNKNKHSCSIISRNEKQKLKDYQKNKHQLKHKQYDEICVDIKTIEYNNHSNHNNCDYVESHNKHTKMQQNIYNQFQIFNQIMGQKIISFLQIKLLVFSQTAGLTLTNTFININNINNNQFQSNKNRLDQVQDLKLKQKIIGQQISQLMKMKENFSLYSSSKNDSELLQWNLIILQTITKINQTFQNKDQVQEKQQEQGLDTDCRINNLKKQFQSQSQSVLFLQKSKIDPNANNNAKNDFLFVSPTIQKNHYNNKSSYFNSTNNATFQSGNKATKQHNNQPIQRKNISINQFQQKQKEKEKEKQSALQTLLSSEKNYNNQGNIESQSRSRLIQPSFKQLSSPIREVNDYICQKMQNQNNKEQIQLQKLQRYFYSFLICFSAQTQQYSQWVQGLLNKLQIQVNYSSKDESSKQSQSQLILNTQNVLDKLIEILKNKYSSRLNQKYSNKLDFNNNSDRNKVKIVYFSQDLIFVKLVTQFLLVNISQIHKRLEQYIKNVQNFIEITQTINHIKGQNNQNLNQNLEKYLPSADDSLQVQTNNSKNTEFFQNQNQYFTFNQKQLQNLLYQNKKNIILKKSLLNIFDKAIRKICFSRIKHCKRFDFDAAQRIALVIMNTTLYKDRLFSSFVNFKKAFDEQLRIQYLQQIAFQKMMKFKLEKVFLAWKQMKINKEKILKNILKRKNKNIQKDLFLCLSKWRLNTRRNNLNEKIINHSNSCNLLMQKYSSANIRHQATNYKSSISKTHLQKLCERRTASNIKLKNDQILLNQESKIKYGQSIIKDQQKKPKEGGQTCKYNKLEYKRTNDEYQRKVKERLLRIGNIIRIKN